MTSAATLYAIRPHYNPSLLKPAAQRLRSRCSHIHCSHIRCPRVHCRWPNTLKPQSQAQTLSPLPQSIRRHVSLPSPMPSCQEPLRPRPPGRKHHHHRPDEPRQRTNELTSLKWALNDFDVYIRQAMTILEEDKATRFRVFADPEERKTAIRKVIATKALQIARRPFLSLLPAPARWLDHSFPRFVQVVCVGSSDDNGIEARSSMLIYLKLNS